jgi:Na+-translocating ferredoxin:NAD+ oxidoreductase RnfG subunit
MVTALVVAALATTTTHAASTGTFFSTASLLKETFATSARVGFVKVTPASTTTTTKPTTTKPTTTATPVNVFVATSGARVDGYAVVLDELGQHEPITFFVAADAAGNVTRVEVMAYRENYGHEIRSPRYLQQYKGRRLPDGAAPTRISVDAISGATISSNSAGRAVARALSLIALARAQPSPAPSSSSPSSSSSPPSSSSRP